MIQPEGIIKSALITLLLLISTTFLSACQEDTAAMTREEASALTMADFYGDWFTSIPNGEKWRLVLHEDGRFESMSVRNNYKKIRGHWEVSGGALVWKYEGGIETGGMVKEINPIVLKTDNKFMLTERMGMTSVYKRSPR